MQRTSCSNSNISNCNCAGRHVFLQREQVKKAMPNPAQQLLFYSINSAQHPHLLCVESSSACSRAAWGLLAAHQPRWLASQPTKCACTYPHTHSLRPAANTPKKCSAGRSDARSHRCKQLSQDRASRLRFSARMKAEPEGLLSRAGASATSLSTAAGAAGGGGLLLASWLLLPPPSLLPGTCGLPLLPPTATPGDSGGFPAAAASASDAAATVLASVAVLSALDGDGWLPLLLGTTTSPLACTLLLPLLLLLAPAGAAAAALPARALLKLPCRELGCEAPPLLRRLGGCNDTAAAAAAARGVMSALY